MEHAARDVIELGLGNSPSAIRTPQSDEQATRTVAETFFDHAEGDEVDASIDAVYGDTLSDLLPSELRYLLMSWRAAA